MVKGLGNLYDLNGLFSACFGFSQIAASHDLTGELSRRPKGECPVGTAIRVFPPPSLIDTASSNDWNRSCAGTWPASLLYQRVCLNDPIK